MDKKGQIRRFLFLLVGFIVLSAIIVSADAIINPIDQKPIEPSKILKNYISPSLSEKYGSYDMWFLGSEKLPPSKLISYKLEKNSDSCLIDCFAEGTASLYNEGVLFDGISFLNKAGEESDVNYKIYLLGQEDYSIDVPDYKSVCEDKFDITNGTNYQDCHDELTGTHPETRTRDLKEEYEGDVLKAGDYRWRIEAEKNRKDSLDWIINSLGQDLDSWQWWNSSWAYKECFSVVNPDAIARTNDIIKVWINDSSINAHALANRSDIRLVFNDTTELTGRYDAYNISSYLGQWRLAFYDNFTANENRSYCVYYGNPTGSKADIDFVMLEDDFNYANVGTYGYTSKWKNATNLKWLSFNGSEVTMGTTGGTQDVNYGILSQATYNLTTSTVHTRWVNHGTWATHYTFRDNLDGESAGYATNIDNGAGGLNQLRTFATSSIYYKTSPNYAQNVYETNAFSYSASAMSFYRNNVTNAAYSLIATRTPTALLGSPTNLMLGMRSADTSQGNWSVDYVYVYNNTIFNFYANQNVPSVMGAETANSATMTTALISPLNASTNITGVSIPFTCNATTSGTLANTTLSIWNGGLTYNLTQSRTGTYAQSNFTYTFASGANNTYKWNCLSYDIDGTTSQLSSNFTLTINNPPITLFASGILPLNDTNFTTNSVNFSCNASSTSVQNISRITFSIWNMTGGSIFSQYYSYNGSQNLTIANFSYDLPVIDSSYLWGCSANDTIDNNATGENRTLTINIPPAPSILGLTDGQVFGKNQFESFIPLSFNFAVVEQNLKNTTWTLRNSTGIMDQNTTAALSGVIANNFTLGSYSINVTSWDSTNNAVSVIKSFSVQFVGGQAGGGSAGLDASLVANNQTATTTPASPKPVFITLGVIILLALVFGAVTRRK